MENPKVLKALIWREVHAAYRDAAESFDISSVSERCKVVAARAGLVYAVDLFHEQIGIAIDRVPQQARRSAA